MPAGQGNTVSELETAKRPVVRAGLCNMTLNPCVKQIIKPTHYEKTIDVVHWNPKVYRPKTATAYTNVVVNNKKQEPDGSIVMEINKDTVIELPQHENVSSDGKRELRGVSGEKNGPKTECVFCQPF